MGHRVPGGEPRFNDRPQEKLKCRIVSLTGPGEEVPGTILEAAVAGIGREQTETRDQGTCLY